MEYLTHILQEIQQLSLIDWAATITALLYVVLAARQNNWCWFWGIISCSLWAYASFAFYQLYLDALLQVFYVIMSIIGWYQWKRGGKGQTERPINQLILTQHLIYIGIGISLSLAFGYFFGTYTQAAATYWDAFTTIFSVIATILLVQKYFDNWAYWVVIDLAYAGLYASRGAYLFTFLMLIYTGIALVAFLNWRKAYITTRKV